MSKNIDQQSPDKGHAHDHEELFNSEWAKSQENFLLKGLKSGASAAELLSQRADFLKAFKEGGAENILSIAKCSDGRVNDNPELVGDEKLGLAGEGILFSKAELQKFIQHNSGRIKEITSHENCGAAALKFGQMQASGEILPEGVTNSDELGIHFAKQLAQTMGAAYRHIGKEEFSCEVHNERLVVIDGTAKFNPNKMKDFPPRYMSAALGLGASLEYSVKEAEILAGISLGDHGFDKRFDSSNPFYIMVIAANPEQLEATLKSLDGVVAKSNGRIKVSGLVAPELE